MRVNYLNNKDILAEIHKSKKSYCSYKVPAEDSDYDLIVKDLEQINEKNIRAARKARAERLTKLALDVLQKTEPTAKADQVRVKPRSIKDQDIVFRVMTDEHIPVESLEEIDPELADLHTEYDDEVEPAVKLKVNFPPFQHFRLDLKGVPKCVGKSHWIGDLKKGTFSPTHGQMTPKLATMFMKLCDRYATRSNWRGYTYNDEMRSQALLQLSQVGLQFNEMKGSNPFAYYTAVITNSFTRVLNVEKKNQNIRDDILEMNNYNPSYTRQNSGGGMSSDGE